MTEIAGEAHADGATLLELGPGGTTWTGSIGLSACLTGLIGSSGTTATPCVKVTGDLNLPDGTIVAELCLGVPEVNLLALLGVSNNNSTQQAITLTSNYPDSEQATLTLHFNGATAATAVATGQG